MVPWQEQALYQMCIYSRTQELITQYSLFSILKICLNTLSKYWIPISTFFLPSCNSEFPCTLILSKWIQIFTITEENYRYGQGWLGWTLCYQIIIWGNIVRCTGYLAGRQPLKPEGHQAELESHGSPLQYINLKAFSSRIGFPFLQNAQGCLHIGLALLKVRHWLTLEALSNGKQNLIKTSGKATHSSTV